MPMSEGFRSPQVVSLTREVGIKDAWIQSLYVVPDLLVKKLKSSGVARTSVYLLEFTSVALRQPGSPG